MPSYLSSKDKIMRPLDAAIERDAFTYLGESEQGQDYLIAIREALAAGARPEDVRSHMMSEVGPDRLAWALRCSQAARYIWRNEFAPEREEVEIAERIEQDTHNLKHNARVPRRA